MATVGRIDTHHHIVPASYASWLKHKGMEAGGMPIPGDVIMSSSWKLLGPLEAADGLLMFGVSTAIIISVVQLIIRTRFRDLPNL